MSSYRNPRALGPAAALVLLLVLGAYAGVFSPWNQRLGDARMALSQRPAEGEIVFVAVDAQSLAEVGTWPWSRAVHAVILDRLTEAGALDVMFDFDFAFPADPTGDAAFEQALIDAGGATYLAVFEQGASATDQSARHYNVPLPNFARNSWPASVNVHADASGYVRFYPYGTLIDGAFVASAGTLFANRFEPDETRFEIDFSIEAGSIPVVSAAEVLRGTVAPDIFAGRSVIVGASAVELADQLAVPVNGVIPGPLLHALAAETLLQGRAVHWLRGEWMVLALLFALGAFRAVRNAGPFVCLIGATLLLASVELTALILFRGSSIMIPSAVLYPGLLCLVLATLTKSLRSSNWLLLKTSAEARNSLHLLERVFDDSSDGVVILGAQGQILRHSASAARMFEAEPDGSLALPERLRFAKPLSADAPLQTIQTRSANGNRFLQYRATQSEVERPTRVGKPPELEQIKTLVLRDITQLKEQEQDIAYLSNYDDRTGAMRRHAFLEFLKLRLNAGQDTIVFAFTLDRFKTINVTLGRIVGDAILKEVVARLETSSMLLSAPARLDGTSFAVFTESTADFSHSDQMAETLLEEIGAVYRMKDANAQVGVRVGYSEVPEDADTTAEVALDQAVEAMDEAKLLSSPVAHYDHTAWARQKRAREIERAMEPALKNGEFEMVYQPQHSVADGSLVGAEALIRWNSPTLGPVYPDEFICIAESTGLIVELGNWTLEQAARDALKLPSHLVIAVNVSAIQIMRGNLVDDTILILKKVGLPPNRICLELTETVMLSSHRSIVETMQDLRFLGITWALDDFGTGFSSMEYLSKMPLDKVKLDKSFIMNLGHDPTARPILHSTSELCRGLGVKLLCEGVETTEQLAVLRQEGCDEAQGFLFGKPQTIDELKQCARTGSGG